jgi:hypothetical protein
VSSDGPHAHAWDRTPTYRPSRYRWTGQFGFDVTLVGALIFERIG